MTAEVTAAEPAAVRAAVSLTTRRVIFAVLVALTTVGVLILGAQALAPGGFGLTDIVLLGLFAITLPWMVIGFWNAAIGLVLMRCTDDPVATVFPAAARSGAHAPITGSTAILICVRNEDPGRVLRNVRPLLAGLADAGVGDRFHLYLLSDTNDPAIASEEERQSAALAAAWQGRIAVTYRRRTSNEGFKAGNIADFGKRWGDGHDFALTLDADSLMPADAVLRLVRLIASEPKLGILQGLVVGLPAASAFARLFQFGMRLGMRSYTIGSAWWQGDCGPYWGHNAILRLQPFIAHCELSALADGGPLAGHVLSHDQIEAVLMRRAGYAVRVLPEEQLGWEENPPTLLDFIRRDLRWCQGNMQYWRFLGLRGLQVVSRFQLVFAILMFIGSPAWIALLTLGTVALAAAAQPAAMIDPRYAWPLLLAVLTMWFAPPIASAIDVLLHPPARLSFGGPWRFVASVAATLAFNLALAPVMWLAHTIFLGRISLGREPTWGRQQRDAHAVLPAEAVAQLWPQTALGAALLLLVALTHPTALPYALIFAAGLVLAVPLALATASPACGRFLIRAGLTRLPEELAPPPILRDLALPAIASPHEMAPLAAPVSLASDAAAAGQTLLAPAKLAECSKPSVP